MRRFTRLFRELDRTTRTTDKVRALESYFSEAPAEDAVWALHVLLGRRRRRPVSGPVLREWTAKRAGLPAWLVEESYHQVGDLAETVALVLPAREEPADIPLHRIMEELILPLSDRPDDENREPLMEALAGMTPDQRFVLLKLMTGGFRVGAGRKLVTRALAKVAGVEPAAMAHRLAGKWEPDPESWARFLAPEDEEDPARPYPFFLAHPLEDDPATLGKREAWQVEWKWDGIRLQVIRRAGETLLWSRGGELVTHQFPEIEEAARAAVPDGTVLDGEAVAWKDGGPLPFGALQRRLGRKKVGATLRKKVPVAFLAYDVMEAEGTDVRRRPQAERRTLLEELMAGVRARDEAAERSLHLSPLVDAADWDAVSALRGSSRERGVEGFMLKRRDAEYGVGRITGPWWKWKVEPLELDAVLIYAQAGHGRRAGLHTDYTFGVWDGNDLVPVGKAYSGLTDKEIRRLDRWIRRNTLERFGPVRSVEREHVFQLAFDGIRASSRHKSGVALRFPRIARWREDKAPEEANTLEEVRGLLRVYGDAVVDDG